MVVKVLLPAQFELLEQLLEHADSTNSVVVTVRSLKSPFDSIDNETEEVTDSQDGEIEITKDDKGFKLTAVNLEITETSLKILMIP